MPSSRAAATHSSSCLHGLCIPVTEGGTLRDILHIMNPRPPYALRDGLAHPVNSQGLPAVVATTHPQQRSAHSRLLS